MTLSLNTRDNLLPINQRHNNSLELALFSLHPNYRIRQVRLRINRQVQGFWSQGVVGQGQQLQGTIVSIFYPLLSFPIVSRHCSWKMIFMLTKEKKRDTKNKMTLKNAVCDADWQTVIVRVISWVNDVYIFTCFKTRVKSDNDTRLLLMPCYCF